LCYGSHINFPKILVNVSGVLYNTRMTKYQKYTWVCTGDCDALIEYTIKDEFGWPNGEMNLTCRCGSDCTLLSVEDATIQPTNEREQMETSTTYDANVLVTYKSINNGEVTYPTLKVNELEYKLDSLTRLEKQLTISNDQLSQIINNLNADGWYNPNYEKAEVLNDLCEILGHEPKQTVRITGTISFEIDYDIPLEEVEDFDAHYFLQDTLTLDAYNGDVVVESWTVEDSDVDWRN
jgi:hypothetical protein